MSELKEVGFVIDSLSIGTNVDNQIVNIMAKGRGLSSSGLVTREFSYNLRDELPKKVVDALEKDIVKAIKKLSK